MILNINPNWTFKETVDNLKTLKTQYKEVLASFSYFEMPSIIISKKQMRDDIYSLSFETWRKDKIWEYMNDFEFLDVLQKLK